MKGDMAPPKVFMEISFWATLLWNFAAGGDNRGFTLGLASHRNIAYNRVHESTEKIVRQEIIAVGISCESSEVARWVMKKGKPKMRLLTTACWWAGGRVQASVIGEDTQGSKVESKPVRP